MTKKNIKFKKKERTETHASMLSHRHHAPLPLAEIDHDPAHHTDRQQSPAPPSAASSSRRSPLSEATEARFSLSPVEMSGYERVEEISCEMAALRQEIRALLTTLRRPPRRPEEQHISLPLSVWTSLVQGAEACEVRAAQFEK